MMETTDLATRLKALRAARGMSQEYLAEESRVSLRTIQRIENNESKPTGETIKRIAHALEVPLAELTDTSSAAETSDLSATIVFLKKQLSKAETKSNIKTFERFISILKRLKERELTTDQLEGIESYIQYLELEKIPSFHNEMYKQKLTQFRKYLKNKLRFVPTNHYTTWTASFGISFAIGFAVQSNIDTSLKIGVIAAAALLIGIGLTMDTKMKRQKRSFSF